MKSYESLERVKLICDENTKRFQRLINPSSCKLNARDSGFICGIFWQVLFDFQLELLKAERDEVPVNEVSYKEAIQSVDGATWVRSDKFPPKPAPDIDPMEAAAIDAGYIKDVRDKLPSDDEYLAPIGIGQAWRYVGDGSDFFTISKIYVVMEFNEIGDITLIDDNNKRHPWSQTAFRNDFVRVQLS